MGLYNAIGFLPEDPDKNLYFSYASDHKINTRGNLKDAYHEGIRRYGLDILIYFVENTDPYQNHAVERRYDLQLGNYYIGCEDMTRREVIEWNKNWCRR